MGFLDSINDKIDAAKQLVPDNISDIGSSMFDSTEYPDYANPNCCAGCGTRFIALTKPSFEMPDMPNSKLCNTCYNNMKQDITEVLQTGKMEALLSQITNRINSEGTLTRSGYEMLVAYCAKKQNRSFQEYLNECELSRHPGQTSKMLKTVYDDAVYYLEGARGRSIAVYEDRCIIHVEPTAGAIIAGNSTDGDKIIFYKDCVGIQYKPTGFTLGYLQLETSSCSGNNASSNFFNENTFTYEKTPGGDDNIEDVVLEIIKYIVDKVSTYKKNDSQSFSKADEIRKFKELLDCGAVTQEEYDEQKKAILESDCFY